MPGNLKPWGNSLTRRKKSEKESYLVLEKARRTQNWEDEKTPDNGKRALQGFRSLERENRGKWSKDTTTEREYRKNRKRRWWEASDDDV